jgi:ATPase subunit of ABC transporter with duplicated ATPase domains
MLLKSVRISHFKHVLDSTLVQIQPDITCLVGKNESGKSTFLEALRRLKPAQGAVNFSSPKHYPAWLEKRHRREANAKGESLDESSPITATFGIEEPDREAVSTVFGDGVLISEEFEIKRKYTNEYDTTFQVDEPKAVTNLLTRFEFNEELASLEKCQSFSALRKAIADFSLGTEGGFNLQVQRLI